MEEERISQIRKKVKSAAADLQQKAKISPDVFVEVGRAFIGGVSAYKEKELGDPLSITVPNMPLVEYRRREFLYGFASARRVLGHGQAVLGHPTVDDSYMSEVKDIKGDIMPDSIGNCVIAFMRNGMAFEYAPGSYARGYEGIAKILASDKFLGALDSKYASEAFFDCIHNAVKRRK